jgi:hypothetical protein
VYDECDRHENSAAKCIAAKGDIDGVLRDLRELKWMGASQQKRLLSAREGPGFSSVAGNLRFQMLLE